MRDAGEAEADKADVDADADKADVDKEDVVDEEGGKDGDEFSSEAVGDIETTAVVPGCAVIVFAIA